MHDHQLALAGFGLALKAERIYLRLKNLAVCLASRQRHDRGVLTLGKLITRSSRMVKLPSSCTADVRSSISYTSSVSMVVLATEFSHMGSSFETRERKDMDASEMFSQL